MLQELKTLNLDRLGVEEAMAHLMFARQLQGTYTLESMVEPEWLINIISSLEKEVRARRRDNLEKALRQKQLELEGLKTAAEKRTEAQREIERLQRLLG